MRPRGAKFARIGFGSSLLTCLLIFAAAWFANDSLPRRYPPPGMMVSIGTHQLHLYCVGRGGPTVILESGIGSGWETWGSVFPKLTRSTRVCVYDRSGYGWSNPDPGRQSSAARLADELHSLLRAAPVDVPYLLVAHSFGAYIARIYADRFGSELTGMVLVDPASEDEPHLHSLYRSIHSLIPPSDFPAFVPFLKGDGALSPLLKDAPAVFRNRFFAGFSKNEAVASRRELSALDASEAEVRATHLPVDLPLIVISATHIVTTDRASQPEMPNPPEHIQLQAKLARSSTRGRQVVVKSGHMIQLEHPDVIVASIDQLIECCQTRVESAKRASLP